MIPSKCHLKLYASQKTSAAVHNGQRTTFVLRRIVHYNNGRKYRQTGSRSQYKKCWIIHTLWGARCNMKKPLSPVLNANSTNGLLRLRSLCTSSDQRFLLLHCYSQSTSGTLKKYWFKETGVSHPPIKVKLLVPLILLFKMQVRFHSIIPELQSKEIYIRTVWLDHKALGPSPSLLLVHIPCSIYWRYSDL